MQISASSCRSLVHNHAGSSPPAIASEAVSLSSMFQSAGRGTPCRYAVEDAHPTTSGEPVGKRAHGPACAIQGGSGPTRPAGLAPLRRCQTKRQRSRHRNEPGKRQDARDGFSTGVHAQLIRSHHHCSLLILQACEGDGNASKEFTGLLALATGRKGEPPPTENRLSYATLAGNAGLVYMPRYRLEASYDQCSTATSDQELPRAPG